MRDGPLDDRVEQRGKAVRAQHLGQREVFEDQAGHGEAEHDDRVRQYPVVAGSGVPPFRADFAPRAFVLTGSRTFERGNAITYARTSG